MNALTDFEKEHGITYSESMDGPRAIEIRWAGGWEEFGQKSRNSFLFQYWKDIRLKLEKITRD